MPRFYLDLRKHFKAMATGETPWTPSIAVAFQVDEGIRLMNEEGQAGVFARHLACAAASQAGLEALGFQLFAEPSVRSKTVTAAWIPEGLDWKAFNGELKRRDLVLAGGQGKLTGKVFRLGHLGSVTLDEIVEAIETIEAVSIESGREVTAGDAPEAARRAAAEAGAAAGTALQPA
jgi:aspartate aminotransferase-like enzyme